MLVSASWTTRYAERSTPAGSSRGSPCTVRSTGSPAVRADSSRVSRVPSPGCGPLDGRAAVGTEYAEHRAELVERLAAGVLDGFERCDGALGLAVDHGLPGLGLHHDRRDRMGDHVVQLAGDPAALVGDGEQFPLGLGCLELAGLVPNLGN